MPEQRRARITKNREALLLHGLKEFLVRRVGFEPATPWFVARCSIQLSYGRINELLLYGSFEKKQIFLKKLLEFLLDDC